MVAQTIALPNLRELYIPDPGYMWFEGDLDRADLQVVVWEADDAELKQMLREGADLHLENAKVLFNKPNLTKDSPERQFSKVFIHGTNYGGGARTMAINCGCTVAEAERMQLRWFSAHPGIKVWHKRVEKELATTHKVSNRFGQTRRFFDRLEGLLQKGLAWVPQSTVARVINTALLNIDERLSDVKVETLLQVHDSLPGQYPLALHPQILPALYECFRVTVPYEDPLIIPATISISPQSWGHVQEVNADGSFRS